MGCGIPHLAKNERDAPNFLHAALDTTTCAPFFKERRIRCAEPSKVYRKSGVWGTLRFVFGTEFAVESAFPGGVRGTADPSAALGMTNRKG
jgi:hypothetical protein